MRLGDYYKRMAEAEDRWVLKEFVPSLKLFYAHPRAGLLMRNRPEVYGPKGKCTWFGLHNRFDDCYGVACVYFGNGSRGAQDFRVLLVECAPALDNQYGKRMMKELVDTAKELGCTRFAVYSGNKEALEAVKGMTDKPATIGHTVDTGREVSYWSLDDLDAAKLDDVKPVEPIVAKSGIEELPVTDAPEKASKPARKPAKKPVETVGKDNVEPGKLGKEEMMAKCENLLNKLLYKGEAVTRTELRKILSDNGIGPEFLDFFRRVLDENDLIKKSTRTSSKGVQGVQKKLASMLLPPGFGGAQRPSNPKRDLENGEEETIDLDESLDRDSLYQNFIGETRNLVKMSWREFKGIMRQWNRGVRRNELHRLIMEPLNGIIVLRQRVLIDQDDHPEELRAFLVGSDEKYFGDYGGDSLYGDYLAEDRNSRYRLQKIDDFGDPDDIVECCYMDPYDIELAKENLLLAKSSEERRSKSTSYIDDFYDSFRDMDLWRAKNMRILVDLMQSEISEGEFTEKEFLDCLKSRGVKEDEFFWFLDKMRKNKLILQDLKDSAEGEGKFTRKELEHTLLKKGVWEEEFDWFYDKMRKAGCMED